MIPAIGQWSLQLALSIALLQFVLSFGKYYRLVATGAVLQFLLVLLSFLALMFSFAVNDFSLVYVAQNSNTLLPLQYRLSATWGAHEGSLLLWLLILTGWMFVLALRGKALPPEFKIRALGVMSFLSVLFLSFTLFTSNPFMRFPGEFPIEGADLNPLLQDIGLILHPPMLYMGYVGFSIAFAFAIAALWLNDTTLAWSKWLRPWVLSAWSFLTVGIALGSWWAYYELGWGGWWFWDPVENASFMPWLMGTALIHALLMTEKRGSFQSWGLLLAILTFAFSVLGTFLVRSGVLTSVHAFASDPKRGIFILAILGIAIGGGLLLFAKRARQFSNRSYDFKLFSRETLILVNNLLLVVAAFTVLLGTLYPLILEVISGDKISVGPPYFNRVFAPFMVLLLLLMGVGILIQWQSASWVEFLKRHYKSWLVIVLVSVGIGYSQFKWLPFLVVSLALWVVWTLIWKIWQKKTPFSFRFFGMIFAHFGFAMAMSGAVWVNTYQLEQDVSLKMGEKTTVGKYSFELQDIRAGKGPNYLAVYGLFEVTKEGRYVATLMPEKRLYTAKQSMMTEAAIDPGFFRDLYVSLGEPLGRGAWSARIHYKPLIRWIWLGAMLMAIGGILAGVSRKP